MGERLVKAYEFAREQGGVTAQMKLSIKTLMPIKQAAKEPDTEENILKTRRALQEIFNDTEIPDF